MKQQKSYRIQKREFPESICIVSYTLDNKLVAITFNEDALPVFQCNIAANLPVFVDDLKYFYKQKYTIKYISELDLSFKAFWLMYNYKVGKKARAEKLWKALNPEEKIMALSAIRKYTIWQQKKNLDKCYPETYLSSRRWENEFE